jgi:hypothetical protein
VLEHPGTLQPWANLQRPTVLVVADRLPTPDTLALAKRGINDAN